MATRRPLVLGSNGVREFPFGDTLVVDNLTLLNGVGVGLSLANYLQVSGSASGARPTILAQGADTNVSLALGGQGSGTIYCLNPLQLTTALSVANGGTGGTTQAAARTGLGLAAVAASGSYADLQNPPAIPAPSNAAPATDGTASAGSSAAFSRADHVHGTDASRYAASNPAGYQSAAQVQAAITAYTNGSSFFFGNTGTTSNTQFEIGSLSTANYVYFDFHSSGVNNDYDVRLGVSGGVSGTSGQGTYQVSAASFLWNGNTVLTTGAPVTVAQGGTGAATPAAALQSLGAAPAANPTFSGIVTLGQSGNGPINIGGTGSYFGSNVTYSGGFKYIVNDYAWWFRSDGSPGISLHVAGTGTAGQAIADVTAMTVSNTGVVAFPAAPLGIASGGTGGTTQAAARTGLGLAAVAASGSYADLQNPPAIPAASNAAPQANGTAAAGTSAAFSRSDHVHATDATRVAKTGDTMSGPLTVQGVLTGYQLAVASNPTSATWQNQGLTVGWNYTGGGGETDFINSRGTGGGGFRWYDTATAANSTPNLLAVLGPTGALTLQDVCGAPDFNLAGSGSMAGAWTSVAAAAVAGSGTGFTATGTIRYKKFGRIVFINVDVQISASGNGAGSVNVTLPFANNPSMQSFLSGRELVSSGVALNGYIAAGSSTLIVTTYANAFPGAMMGASRLSLTGVYEASA